MDSKITMLQKKSLITGEDIQIKIVTLEIEKDFKIAKNEAGNFIIKGYANTKNRKDRYGDIPTNFNGKDVYNLKLYNKNPVALLDHINSAAGIMGVMTAVEDEKGLYVEEILRKMEDVYVDRIKDAISAVITGFSRAYSIGGRWYYEDKENPMHLTTADIHEISHVGVGADPYGLTNTPRPKHTENGSTKIIEADRQRKVADIVGKIRSGDATEEDWQELAKIQRGGVL